MAIEPVLQSVPAAEARPPRLDSSVFKLDVERMRQGWYSDHYFNNIVTILENLAREGYTFRGSCPELEAQGVSPEQLETGNIEVDMQIFTRREPFSLCVGTDQAIAMIKLCAGYFDERGQFVSTWDRLQVRAVRDGTRLLPWVPAMRIRGRYRDFARLETPILGAISRRTKVATNVYRTMEAARGKPVLFFPARFDIHEAQAGDGYAYNVAVHVYDQERGGNAALFISTAAQGDWWGQKGGGTTSHSYLICFLRDTVEAMLAFARVVPPDVPRVALVDVNNDCVGDSVAVAKAFFQRYRELTDAGDHDEACRYILFGVRPDTAGNLRDVSVPPIGDPAVDCGVCPRLVHFIRAAFDAVPSRLDLPEDWRDRAEAYFRSIKIVATGGFNVEKIKRFEALNVPVDIYGVGSSLLEGECNDFTSDIVQVKIGDQWYDMAKVGRQAIENPDLELVE